MPTPWQRDLDETRAKLCNWLATVLPDANDLEVSNLAAPSASGFSNETLLFDLTYRDAGARRAEALVIRIQPTGFPVFPAYDVALQFRTMELLAKTDVPVPRMRWLEAENRDLFGAPFYVMDRVHGRVPSDNPPYHHSGWLHDAPPEEQAAVWLGGFESMAKIHRLDHRAAGFSFLEKPELGRTGVDEQIALYQRYFEWAARGVPQPTTEAAFDWVRANRPDDDRRCLVWGDARIGNILFDGATPAAVLDWEMVCTGSPEMDVGWAIFLDRHHSEGIETPRLPGFPSYEETIAHYEECSGFEVRNLDFFQVFTGVRFAVIMIRIAQQLVHYGVMDPAQGLAFELNNTVTRLLAKLLDLPAPGESAGAFDG